MAGSNDFTGQNIQDSYQRVLQLSSSGQLADGTGSLVPLLDVTASFAVSASHEITFELSSSHATNADTASFATNFTASGNISASGNIIATDITVAEIIASGNIRGSSILTNGTITSLSGSITHLVNVNTSHVTASGNISASGNIIGIINGGTF